MVHNIHAFQNLTLEFTPYPVLENQTNLLSTHNTNQVPEITLGNLLIITMPLDPHVKNKETTCLIDM